MNEIIKLYENAGVEKQYYSFKCSDGNIYNWELNENGNDKYNMCFIGKPEIKERTFTAEKQLELIKFLLNQGVYYSTFPNNTYQFHISDDIENPQPRKFDIAIAEIINDLWQDLTEEERKQIADILR